MCFCAHQACLIVLNHYNSICSGNGKFSVPFCLCLRLPRKTSCVEPVAMIFPLSRHYDALGSLGLLLCPLGIKVECLWATSRSPHGKKGHPLGHRIARGRLYHRALNTLHQSHRLFLFGFQLQSFLLSWTGIPSFIFQCCKPCSSPRALKVKLLSQA